MHSKELKRYFRNMVNRQVNHAVAFGNINEFMWICLYYLDGLNDAICITQQYESYVKPFSSESFEYIFRTIVEYRKGVC